MTNHNLQHSAGDLCGPVAPKLLSSVTLSDVMKLYVQVHERRTTARVCVLILPQEAGPLAVLARLLLCGDPGARTAGATLWAIHLCRAASQSRLETCRPLHRPPRTRLCCS